MARPRLTVASYRVGIICALSIELEAVLAAFDTEYEQPAGNFHGDKNQYAFGRIGEHNVVVCCLPEGSMGKAAAACAASDMSRSFPIHFGLIVGICGGVPSDKDDIRLGDVVVGRPTGIHPGLIQWDFGKRERHGLIPNGVLNRPPDELLNALSFLIARHGSTNRNGLAAHLRKMHAQLDSRFDFPGVDCDRRRKPHFLLHRRKRTERVDPELPRIHYGNIASGDEVIKDATTRDRLAKQLNVIAFEMEAAGAMVRDGFRCLVVKGVSDYADLHKDKQWQPYAAATAAAFTKELLANLPLRSLERFNPFTFEIPFSFQDIPMTGNFVQRPEQMESLEKYFLPTERQAQTRRRLFVVHGMGGMGKTQLCAEFARKNKDRFSATLWFDGSSMDALLQSFSRISSRIPGLPSGEVADREDASDVPSGRISNQKRAITPLLSWLSTNSNNRWLLIFDNVDRDWTLSSDSQTFNFETFLPTVDHGNVIITTRLARLGQIGASLELREVSMTQAKEILVKNSGRRELRDCGPLLERLDGLPLAISQAGAYLARTSISVPQYIQHYESTWARLMTVQARFRSESDSGRSILTTWTMSSQQVAKSDPIAASLLRLWAFFDHNDVWYDLISAGWRSSKVDWPTWYADLCFDQLAFESAAATLHSYSLIMASSDCNSYSMHPVLHSWNRHQVRSSDERDEVHKVALRTLGVTLSSGHWWQQIKRNLPHVQVQLEGSENLEGPEIAGSLVHLAWALGSSGIHKIQLQLARRAADMRSKELGSEHILTHLCLLQVAQGLVGLEKSTEAESIVVPTLKTWQLKSPESRRHPVHVALLGVLAISYLAQSKHDEAKLYCTEALSMSESVHGTSGRKTLYYTQVLAEVHRLLGNPEQAKVLYLRTYRGYQDAKHFTDDPAKFAALRDLGGINMEQRHLDEAREAYEQAMVGLRKVYGWDDEETLLVTYRLGVVCEIQQDLRSCETLYQRTGEVLEQLGKRHWREIGEPLCRAAGHRIWGDKAIAQRLTAEAFWRFRAYQRDEAASGLEYAFFPLAENLDADGRQTEALEFYRMCRNRLHLAGRAGGELEKVKYDVQRCKQNLRRMAKWGLSEAELQETLEKIRPEFNQGRTDTAAEKMAILNAAFYELLRHRSDQDRRLAITSSQGTMEVSLDSDDDSSDDASDPRYIDWKSEEPATKALRIETPYDDDKADLESISSLTFMVEEDGDRSERASLSTIHSFGGAGGDVDDNLLQSQLPQHQASNPSLSEFPNTTTSLVVDVEPVSCTEEVPAASNPTTTNCGVGPASANAKPESLDTVMPSSFLTQPAHHGGREKGGGGGGGGGGQVFRGIDKRLRDVRRSSTTKLMIVILWTASSLGILAFALHLATAP